jgi:hypothetical protein
MNSFDTTGGDHGYGLFAGPANNWEGAVGTPGGPVFLSGPEILFDTTNHIVLTYDGHLLRLFVNGTQTAAIAGNYQPSAQAACLSEWAGLSCRNRAAPGSARFNASPCTLARSRPTK